MTKIKIGADELILWLCKNHKAVNIPNQGIDGLGRKLHDLIVYQLGGSKYPDDFSSLWFDYNNIEIVNETMLPKTSAQYELETSQLANLYSEIDTW